MKSGQLFEKIFSFLTLTEVLSCALLLLNSCHTTRYYTPADFSSVKKIDVHTHINSTHPAVAEQAIKDNVVLISVNVEVPTWPLIDSQQYFAIQSHKKFPAVFFYITTLETKTINQPGWSGRQLERIKESLDSGALAVKVWKNIGMVIKDKDSNFIMIDDPIFDPIFDFLEKKNIPVIGHLGEPKNCWLPLDQMTTNNDRDYFRKHPEYHMYLHPEDPSYETIIRARDHLLEKHPDLRFIGAHLASLEWDVDEIAKRLDQFPNMSVEPAERMGQLHFQSIKNWQKVHDFFIKYQDRIMYGTDFLEAPAANADSTRKKAHDLWMNDWMYFTTGDSLQSPFVDRKFKGLRLPKEVVNKIYYRNAEKIFFGRNE